MSRGATGAPPAGLPDLDPRWSRTVPVTDAAGASHDWHVLDTATVDPVLTLLCVHGNPTWSYLWRRLLTAAPPTWRVVAPDQLGMGYSERPPGVRRLAQRIADLGDLTEALGVTGPVVTVGHDWGGVVSLGWALRHRDALRAVVLTNTAVAQPEGDLGPPLIRLAHVPALREVACVRTPLFVRATSGLSRPALPAAVREALAAPYAQASDRRAVGDFVADIPFAHHADHPSRAAQEDVAGQVRSLDVPALLLWGPRDPVFGERYLADLRRRLPHADLHRFEGASHLVTEDAPQYADATVAWVRDLTGPVASADGRPGDGSPVPARAPDPARDDLRLWSALEARSADPGVAVSEVAGATLSWAELAGRVRDLASGLVADGLRPGQRVAMLVEPSVDLTVAVYAVWRAGGVVVVADKGLGLAGMRRALRSAAPDLVVGSGAGLAAARAMGLPAARVAAGPISRRLHGPVGGALTGALGVRRTLADLTELGRHAAVPEPPPLDADCAVLFTSGATGPAKGVVYRHAQAAAQLALVRSTYALGPGDRMVAAFAPFALLGPALGVASCVPAIDVTAPGTLTAAKLADAAAAVDATVVFASPAALRSVVATADALTPTHRVALTGVRLLMSAGAPVPAALLRSVLGLLPAAEAHTPYGMTEALPVTDVTLTEIEQAEIEQAETDRAGRSGGVCVGRPLPGVEVALLPLDDTDETTDPATAATGGLTVDPGRTGEICVRAGHVKDRYDHLWATQHASARPRGWHRTGDVGHLDEAGRLWVEGRLAHVVSTAAGPVTPVGPEQQIEALDGVRAAAVVGVGPPGTQVVVVVLVLDALPKPGPGPGLRSWVGSRARSWPGVRVRTRSGLHPAGAALSDAVRACLAPLDVAAVLGADALPLDIRHASKVDRAEVARRAACALAGGR